MPTTTASAALLVELFTEELPPHALKSLGEAFSQGLVRHLHAAGLLARGPEDFTGYASPRRLAVLIPEVLGQAPEQNKKEKLLPASVGLDAQGSPTAPLVKKLASLGLVLGENLLPTDLLRESDGKAETLFVQTRRPGAALQPALQAALEATLQELPIPKLMRYQRTAPGEPVREIRFVRPAHGLLVRHGSAIVACEVLGLQSRGFTHGHRFHAPGAIEIPEATQYEALLESVGKVMPHAGKRRAAIEKGLKEAAARGGQTVVMPEALLDEVNALVEWPVVLEGHFEEAFLEVPQECLILTMQQNQKYFALTDAQGRLANRFLLVSHLQAEHPELIVGGNERVLRARLADAQFFFTQDRLQRLEARLPALESIVYHNKIGSLRARVDRLVALAGILAPAVGAAVADAQRAALLAKADLVTDMVGEFPELQGLMGGYYARHDGETADVAQAIADQYRPRFAGDGLAQGPVGLALALADRLETLVGIFGIGLIPTGDKDPFALRRAALGVVRTIVERGIRTPLSVLLVQAAEVFQGVAEVRPDLAVLRDFILDRARGLLRDQGHGAEAIEAVLAVSADRLDQVPDRLEALQQFLATPEAESLCAANKRIGNILKKSADTPDMARAADPLLFQEAAEKSLGQALGELAPKAVALCDRGDYAGSLQLLAGLKAPVDAFFDSVMVNAEDPAVRRNRLALLAQAHRAMNQVGDLGRLLPG